MDEYNRVKLSVMFVLQCKLHHNLTGYQGKEVSINTAQTCASVLSTANRSTVVDLEIFEGDFSL